MAKTAKKTRAPLRARIPWTDRDIDTLRKFAGKKRVAEIAATLKPPRTEGAVRQKMFAMELSARA